MQDFSSVNAKWLRRDVLQSLSATAPRAIACSGRALQCIGVCTGDGLAPRLTLSDTQNSVEAYPTAQCLAELVRTAELEEARELQGATLEVHAAELRSAWLAELEADARTWITPDRIDELITPALFSQKFGWQWEDWFSSKELKRQLREDARRTRRAGVPLTEVQLPPTLQPYAEDWESGGEEEAEGAEAAAALAPASREAARHASPAIALALAAAREAARARGMALAEPGYDFDGAALPEGDSAEDVAALRARAAAREGGVSLAELAQGRSLQDILSDYEGWLEAQARELEASLERERAKAGGAEGVGEAEQVRLGHPVAAGLAPLRFFARAALVSPYTHTPRTLRIPRNSTEPGIQCSNERREGEWAAGLHCPGHSRQRDAQGDIR